MFEKLNSKRENFIESFQQLIQTNQKFLFVAFSFENFKLLKFKNTTHMIA